MGKYWYEYRLRGCSPGCQPRGFVDTEDSYGRFGAVAYDRELTDNEIQNYELNVIDESDVKKVRESK